MDAPDPRQPAGDSNFQLIAAGFGGVIVALLGLVGYVVFNGIGLEPAPEVAKAPASRPRSPGTTRRRSRKRVEKKRDIPRKGTPLGKNSGHAALIPPSFGSLNTELDWMNKESQLHSEGTAKALWYLAHLYKNRRNPRHDESTAFRYLQRAFQAGAGVAAFEMGLAYRNGTWRRRKNLQKAKHWFTEAYAYGISNADRALDELEKEGY